MLKTALAAILPFLVLFSNGSDSLSDGLSKAISTGDSGTIEKLVPTGGSVTFDINLALLNGTSTKMKGAALDTLSFSVDKSSMFTLLVFNNETRGPLPSSMNLLPQGRANLPAKLAAAYQSLTLESLDYGDQYDLVIRDGKAEFTFFNIEGEQYAYDAASKSMTITDGRLLISPEFAAAMGRAADAGTVVGTVAVSSPLRTIEVTQVVDGEVRSAEMPAPEVGTVPGPDVIVGDLSGLAQFGSAVGTQVGLSVGTDSCNAGTENLHWFAEPANDHPVIPQNIYRMSGGATNDQRFEQIGQSSVKHAFQALTNNICGFGCNGVGNTNLGSGCSDPYVASLNSTQSGLGSRAWINPFTGAYPRADSGTPPDSHSGHTHNGTIHRMITEIADLNTSLNAGAKYYAEGQYVTPHEYAWCQSNPTQCNMYNNVSYRRYTVSGTGSPFAFSPAEATVRQKAAITAWTGAGFADINPAPGVDGVGIIAYKVTNTSAGVWHYEYAIYNQNMDRAIQSLSVPLGNGITISNAGFHSPPQQPGNAADGTTGNAGFSNAAWAQTQTSASMTWSSDTLAQNPNANALRWGTLYNFRFDSNRPPQTATATIGFFKTGSPITVTVQAPTPDAVASQVSISGRVTNSVGAGIGMVTVVLTDPSGNSRQALTNPFGYYNFENVSTAAGNFTATASAKRYSFSPQTFQVTGNISNIDFTPLP